MEVMHAAVPKFVGAVGSWWSERLSKLQISTATSASHYNTRRAPRQSDLVAPPNNPIEFRDCISIQDVRLSWYVGRFLATRTLLTCAGAPGYNRPPGFAGTPPGMAGMPPPGMGKQSHQLIMEDLTTAQVRQAPHFLQV
jgi:hypothetical protein